MNKQEKMDRTSRGKLHPHLILSFILELSMKPYSIFSGAVRLLALLILSAGLNMSLNGSVAAQEGMQGHDHGKSGPQAQSAGSGKKQQPCGGPSRIQCQGGMVCVDDPSDNCDPTRDGLDCKGMCVSR